MNDDSKRVIYVAPKTERINRYAKDVCNALAARRGNEDVASPKKPYENYAGMRLSNVWIEAR